MPNCERVQNPHSELEGGECCNNGTKITIHSADDDKPSGVVYNKGIVCPTIHLPKTTVNMVLSEMTQKTCSRKTKEPSRPTSLCHVRSSPRRSQSRQPSSAALPASPSPFTPSKQNIRGLSIRPVGRGGLLEPSLHLRSAHLGSPRPCSQCRRLHPGRLLPRPPLPPLEDRVAPQDERYL